MNEILVIRLPKGRVAVFSTYECGSYQPPSSGSSALAATGTTP